MMSPGRRRFNPVPDPVGYSVSPESQIQSIEDAFSRLVVSNPPYVFPRAADYSNVFPYGYVNPSYQSQIPIINNNNQNLVQNNYGVRAPLYPEEPQWRNNLGNSNNVSLISEILERQRREIRERQRREILDRQRRELLASILNQNPSFLDGSVFYPEYNHHVNERGTSGTYWFDNFRGRILEFAKDQCRSRVLQNAMMKAEAEEISCIFNELINHVTDLMLDSSGNYVIQRLVEICNEQQRTLIILMLTMDYFQFSTICKTSHGSRAFEKLLECVTTSEQRTFFMAALTPSAIEFCKDVNAHRVIISCLKYFPKEDTKEFLEVVVKMSSNIAKDKNGCCVLQECVDYAQGETRTRLIDRIVENSLELATHCYGNYVVQKLVTLRIPRVTNNIIRKLEKNFVYLSCNKSASHVVEKLFKNSGEMQSRCIIFELLTDSNNRKLLVDPFANFVIGSALEISRGQCREDLLELIENNSQMMGTNLYGKKLLEKFEKAKFFLVQEADTMATYREKWGMGVSHTGFEKAKKLRERLAIR